MSGDMREVRHLCGHLQPDFGEWVGVAPSMSQKGSLMLRKKVWRQNHQERHQSYPKTGCFASCLGTTLMSWDSSDGFINRPGENDARFRFRQTRARVGAKRSPRLVALGSPPRGDAMGRHNGETKGRQREQKERAKWKDVFFIVCKREKLLCNVLKC